MVKLVSITSYGSSVSPKLLQSELGDLGLDLLSLQCFLPAMLNCYLATGDHTLNIV